MATVSSLLRMHKKIGINIFQGGKQPKPDHMHESQYVFVYGRGGGGGNARRYIRCIHEYSFFCL